MTPLWVCSVLVTAGPSRVLPVALRNPSGGVNSLRLSFSRGIKSSSPRRLAGIKIAHLNWFMLWSGALVNRLKIVTRGRGICHTRWSACRAGRMIQLNDTAYKSEPRNISNLGVIWVTQAETAIRSNQSQCRFGRSLLIMHNTSANAWINTHPVPLCSLTHTCSVTHMQSLGCSATDAFKLHTNGLLFLLCRV